LFGFVERAELQAHGTQVGQRGQAAAVDSERVAVSVRRLVHAALAFERRAEVDDRPERTRIECQGIARATLRCVRVAKRQHGRCQIDMRIDVVLIERDRVAQAGNRARGFAERTHDAAELIVKFGDARIRFDRAHQQHRRILQLSGARRACALAVELEPFAGVPLPRSCDFSQPVEHAAAPRVEHRRTMAQCRISPRITSRTLHGRNTF
jgi:hypothetical protein